MQKRGLANRKWQQQPQEVNGENGEGFPSEGAFACRRGNFEGVELKSKSSADSSNYYPLLLSFFSLCEYPLDKGYILDFM